MARYIAKGKSMQTAIFKGVSILSTNLSVPPSKSATPRQQDDIFSTIKVSSDGIMPTAQSIADMNAEVIIREVTARNSRFAMGDMSETVPKDIAIIGRV